jgi:FeS assembly SUF system regulator
LLRITKLADYGIVLLMHVAVDRSKSVHTARGLSAATHVPLPTVSKILKALARAGLLDSHRGVGGGFALARAPERISVADVVTALEGPISITECLGEEPSGCDIERMCPVRVNWDRVNRAVRTALEGLTIAEMATVRFPFRTAPAPTAAAPAPEAS